VLIKSQMMRMTMMHGERLRCMLCICRYQIVHTMTIPTALHSSNIQRFSLDCVGKLRREIGSIGPISCLVYVQCTTLYKLNVPNRLTMLRPQVKPLPNQFPRIPNHARSYSNQLLHHLKTIHHAIKQSAFIPKQVLIILTYSLA